MTAKHAIVIGGGIAGGATARALAERGLQVTLLERRPQIANGASGNPVAMLYPRLSGSETSSAFALAAYQFSLQRYHALKLHQDVFNACGMLQLGFNEKERARIHNVAAQGYPNTLLQRLNADEATAIAGIPITHEALYFPQAAWVQPQALCEQLTQHKNISVLTLIKVIKLMKLKHKFEIKTEHEQVFHADIVVVASAGDSHQLLPEIKLQTKSVRGQVSLVTPSAESRSLRCIVCSDGYFSPAVRTASGPEAHCVGATFENLESTTDNDHANSLSDQDHEANLDKLNDISPSIFKGLQNPICGGRASIRCTAVDYWPIAGQLLDGAALQRNPPRPHAPVSSLPWIKGLYINVAHGSKGFITAPLCAEMIASHATGGELPISTQLAGLLNPNRFLLKQYGLKQLAKRISVPSES